MSKISEFTITSLVKSYNKIRVLDVAQLSLKPGQFVALMGKNGCGKSTIMRLLAQQELFDSGNISFAGTSLPSWNLKLNPQMVYISEEHELPFSEPLNYWLKIHVKLHPDFDQNIFEQLTRSLEIDVGKSFHSLSRGQKMKALFCLQAPKRPDIYLLDEITSVLDSSSRWTLMRFLKEEIDRGCLVVMSTNIAGELQGFATDVVLLEKGKVIFSCESKTLKDAFRKLRISTDQDSSSLKSFGARRINMNGDGTWTYMHPRASSSINALPGVEEDLREITIADVQSYFTSGETGA